MLAVRKVHSSILVFSFELLCVPTTLSSAFLFFVIYLQFFKLKKLEDINFKSYGIHFLLSYLFLIIFSFSPGLKEKNIVKGNTFKI